VAFSETLETPILLAAMPQVQDPFFHESVVLLVHHDEVGSFGLIVNRPTELKVADVLRGMKIDWSGNPESLAFFGGPVRPQQGTVLYAAGESFGIAVEGASEIFPGVQTTQHFADLEALARKPPSGLRLVLGFAGWGEEQLIDEILRNDWITAPVDIDLRVAVHIFAGSSEKIRSMSTLRSVGVDPASLPSWTKTNDGQAN